MSLKYNSTDESWIQGKQHRSDIHKGSCNVNVQMIKSTSINLYIISMKLTNSVMNITRGVKILDFLFRIIS